MLHIECIVEMWQSRVNPVARGLRLAFKGNNNVASTTHTPKCVAGGILTLHPSVFRESYTGMPRFGLNCRPRMHTSITTKRTTAFRVPVLCWIVATNWRLLHHQHFIVSPMIDDIWSVHILFTSAFVSEQLGSILGFWEGGRDPPPL